MKALLNIKHTIEVNHIKYYEWTLHITSKGFGGVIKGHKQFNDKKKALKSARRAAKKTGIDIRITRP